MRIGDIRTMHRYAGHDARALAKALSRGCSGRARSVELPDAWGNTLLHTACATRGAAPQVALLLGAGAAVNAVGPYGMTPLAAACMARQWKAAARVAKAGGGVVLGAFNEASERSLLANVFGLGGETMLHGQALELGGAFEFGAYPRLGDAVEVFAQTCADKALWSDAQWAQAVRALREAPAHCYVPCCDVVKKIRTGVPVLVPTGWQGHSVCVAIVGGDAVRANRSRSVHPRLQVATLRFWHFGGGAPTARAIACLRNNRGRSAAVGRMVLTWHDATRRASRHRPAVRACAHLAPKPQKADNCTIANAKAGLLALLTLLRARDRQGAAEDSAATRALLHTEYKRLTTFVRLYFLETYRARHGLLGRGPRPGPEPASGPSTGAGDPPDERLVQRCEAKLGAAAVLRPWTETLRAACRTG